MPILGHQFQMRCTCGVELRKDEHDCPIMTDSKGRPAGIACPRRPAEPTLSVEYRTKWYALTLTRPDGTKEEIHFGHLEDFAPPRQSPYVDHVPNPLAVVRMCEHRGYALDELSFELIVGRWEIETLGNYSVES